MKILKPGKKPEEALYRVDCKNCGCLFEFNDSEAKFVPDNRNGDFLTIECPTCRMLVTTKPKR